MFLALCSAVTVGTAPPPLAGVYILEGGGGTLTIARTPKALTFQIEVMGTNAHTCSVEGVVVGTEGRVTADACVVHLEVVGNGVQVSAGDAEACRGWCGARAWFEGRYLTPAPTCRDARVKAARAAFKKHYAAKAWAAAKADLLPLLATCAPLLFRFDLAWIRNDLSITLHHLGDDAGCLKVLEPLRELAGSPDDELGGSEPMFEDEYRKLAKATRTNLAACGDN